MTKTIRTLWWRHGQTDWNAARKWQGHTDIPLNDVGTGQAEALSLFFNDRKLDHILSSDLKRARKTAEIIAERHSVTLEVKEGLREGHYGRAEGLTAPEIRRKFGTALLEKWRSSDPSTFDMEFVGGETKRQIVERVLSTLSTEFADCPHSYVGISTHGGVIRKVVNFIERDYKLPSPIPNCAVFEIDYNPESSEWKLVSMHDPLAGG